MVQGDGGRERAIETLIDTQPQGAFYRAARVLDEVVPQALVNRPNVVTKGALVEQANALAEYEINLSNYDAVFGLDSQGGTSETSSSSRQPSSSSMGALSSCIANSSKDRILRHHAKQCTELQQHQQRKSKSKPKEATASTSASTSASSSGGNPNTTPSPQLVAVLRQIYGSNSADENPSFNFRSLLKAVMDHKVFEVPNTKPTTTAATTTSTTNKASSLASSSASPEVSTESANNNNPSSDDEMSATTYETIAKTPPAQVESLIANVCRLAADQQQQNNKDHQPADCSMVQGLLVAALSVLTQMPTRTNETEGGGNTPNKAKGRTTPPPPSKPNKKSAVAEDPLVSPAMQVGALLSLLKLNNSDSDNTGNNKNKNKENNTSDAENSAAGGSSSSDFQLDPELLQYFGEAAVAYEGRLEIQKARLLAKLQQAVAPSVSDDTTTEELRPAEPISEAPAAAAATESGDEGPVTPVALTPTQVDNPTSINAAASSGGDNDDDDANVNDIPTHFTDQVAILEGDAPLDRLAEATLTNATTLEQIIASAATGDETSSGGEDDDDEEDDEVGMSSDSDDSEDANSEGENESDVDGREQAAGTGAPASEADEAQENEADGENDDEDDDDDESSSSSSSADDWAMMQERTGADSEIDDDDDDEDEDDDDVLQQALALSLSEHDAAAAAAMSNNNATEEVPSEQAQTQSDIQDQERVQTETTPLGTPTASTAVLVPPAITESSEPDISSEGRTLPEEPTKTDESEDFDDLPSLPKPPSAQPYASLLGQPVDVDSDQAMSMESIFAPYFDPSELMKFGSIPTANVLVHLLTFTVEFLERNKFANSAAGKSKDSGKSSEGNTCSLPGGMGLTLFPTSQKNLGFNTGLSPDTSSENTGIAVTLQLLVAFFLQIMEKRNDAIVGLRKAVAQEERHAQGEDAGSDKDSGAEDDKSEGTPLSSEEEDDPAIAFAMNYAEDNVAESSESLEAKGMIRKAAAAAYDAAEVLRLLRRRTDAWKKNVKLYSHCAMYALKSLCQFLRSTVRERLLELQDSKPNGSPVAGFGDIIPSLVGSKLSMSLASLLSVSAHNSFVTLLNGDESETNSVFLSLTLYKEAMATWGECIPLVYPSVSAQVEILRNLISECSAKPGSDSTGSNVRNVDSLTNMPSSELEPQVHRLRMLCKRLRVTDLLDNLVPSPACYLPKDEAGTSSSTSEGGASISGNVGDPFRASPVTSLVGNAAKNVISGRGELQKLFLALCHRFHARVLLWGGFYECTENDVDDVTGAAIAPTVSPGDLVRIGANPSSSLQFDSTKCSDSIAILSNAGGSSSGTNGSSVHQRASKVWGAVLSTHQYSPKTGVHRWAVRLDKCERGHVFVGVATAQASMRTYVGGDKYGWGMIGTQALWHDRRKIRGDYGATFRTGSTIIVTLDTDAGTLSFSSWKDNNASNSFSLDPMLQNQSTSRRGGQLGGTVEDWGVAFEGLPLDSRLYPAVGLYQRDDRVTLLPVESTSRGQSREGAFGLSGGVCFYPLMDQVKDTPQAQVVSQVRRFNDMLSWEGIQYVVETLRYIIGCLEESQDEFVLATLLPSLSAALCLIPNSIPILSERLSLTLLPHLSKFFEKLDKFRGERQTVHRLFRFGLKPGKWTIRATGSSGDSGNYEEYVVDISSSPNEQGSSVGFEGSGVGTTGKSKNGLVAIFGTTKGSSVHFVEEWSDGGDEGFGSSSPDETSSCVVAARLSLDGTKFEGTYRNVQFGTTGQIAGMLRGDDSPLPKFRRKDAPASSKQSSELAGGVVAGEALLCLAYNHMATIVGEDGAGDHSTVAPVDGDRGAQQEILKKSLSGPLLSGSSLSSSDRLLSGQLSSLKQKYAWEADLDDPHGCRHLYLLDPDVEKSLETAVADNSSSSISVREVEEKVDALDDDLCQKSGGKGSLRQLCSSEYDVSRKRIVCALIRSCGLEKDLISNADTLEAIWRVALKVMEDGLREAMANPNEGQSRRESCVERCRLHDCISSFLLSLDFGSDITIDEATREVSTFYRMVKDESDLDYLRGEMEAASRRALLRLVSLREVVTLLSACGDTRQDVVDNPVALEALVVGLPRLLGKSQAEAIARIRKQKLGRSAANDSQDLGSHYSSCSSGSDRNTRHAIHSEVHKMFQVLGRIAEKAMLRRSQSLSSESNVSTDSLLLALLSVFTTTLKQEDIKVIVLESGILEIIPKLIAQHRDAILVDSSSTDESLEDVPVVKRLQGICEREISRSILRAAVAASHALIFQTSHLSAMAPVDRGHSVDEDKAALLCANLLFGELNAMFKCVEKSVAESTVIATAKRADADWKSWCQAKCPVSEAEKKTSRAQIGSAGLRYMQEHGTAHVVGPHATSQKPSSRPKGASSSSSSRAPITDKVAKLRGGFSCQLLSQWLHILCGAINSHASLQIIANDPEWLSLLLKAAGLVVSYDPDNKVNSVTLRDEKEGFLPARFRSRVLRFLLPLFDILDPSEHLLRGLLLLAGAASPSITQNLDEDESFVSREAVTLLRQLHSPTRKLWRERVNKAISSAVSSSSDANSSDKFLLQMGVLSFISGSLEPVGRGSYVLLKPAAAAPLSADQQSSPSSKSHSSGMGGAGSGAGATPHHIVGNGTEGVVAGLCRHDASAGLVSSVDMKNGLCEVVLLARDPEDPSAESQDKSLLKSGGQANARNSLTVRALRAALSDVVHAQEAPLCLDDTMTFDSLFGPMVEPALDTLFAALKTEAHNSYSGVETLKSALSTHSAAIQLVRSAIVVLSDKRIASEFLQNESSRKILSRILQLAWPAEATQDCSDFVSKAQKRYLSSLPIHEARYSHLVSLIRELYSRDQALKGISEERWAERLEEVQRRRSTAQTTETKDAAASSTGDGPGTPAAESGPGSGTVLAGPSNASGAADVDSISRNADSASNRGVSQSTASSEDEEESEATATAAAHLREAAIAQMAELGLPRSWSELALRRTGGTDIEAAVHFCLERGGEMERLLAEERERDRLMQRQAGGGSASRRRGFRQETGSSNHLLRQLLEMGFPSRWCAEALSATGNNVDEALTWILTHGERLSEEDEAMEDEDDGEDVDDEDDDESVEDDEDEDDDADTATESPGVGDTTNKEVDSQAEEANVSAWSGSVLPLRFISGRSIIDPKTLAISGLPTGGFSSVGTKGVLLCSGKWYYEAVLETAGCLQIGWADGSFAGHCHADRGDGTGDGPSSWAFDGWRRYRWHSVATEWGCRWKEGDVVGCLVDMDEHTVSFTLNGKGEEIGMGVAFNSEGFRPCGGVYACVSFNRREKLRLRLTEPFKYQPPPGYQGVGVAVLDSVKERETLALKEEILDSSPDLNHPDPKRFLCDLSDGEHGHELMAWAHRYYGADASVHLGSGRSKQSSGSTKTTTVPSSESLAVGCITRRVEKAWAASDGSFVSSDKEGDEVGKDELVSQLKHGYDEASKELSGQLVNESIAMSILFTRKLILHLVVTLGDDFNLGCFRRENEDEAVSNARQFWRIIEMCGSLRCAGWVGEAGAMAIAAEALGLGISSNDHSHSRQSLSERAGIASVVDLDDGVLLPAGGITQLLSSVSRTYATETYARDTGDLLAACAEAALGSDGGGGVLVFLQKGLQSAVCNSKEFRDVLVAAIRRSIRLLAVVEYEGDDSDGTDQILDDGDPDRVPSSTKKAKDEESDEQDVSTLPDARLTSFLTGLVMSKPVETALSEEDYLAVLGELFQAWSIGLLSASLPWRMVCAFTVAGILNKCPRALLEAVSTFPTLARFYGRLESTVARRVWAERAAVPVCSRYVQAMVELLAAVKRSASTFEMPDEFRKYWGRICVDAATPLPLGMPCVPHESKESYWESDEGWVSSDTSWEVWTGTVEYMAVDWETPSRSPVRSLMDGGEGPPMLREGCQVMRGPDWSYAGNGSESNAEDGDEDGKKKYEEEKAKRDKEKRLAEEQAKEPTSDDVPAESEKPEEKVSSDQAESADPTESVEPEDSIDQPPKEASEPDEKTADDVEGDKKPKKKKIPSPKLPAGTVLSVEPWNGIPGLGRKVRWHLTGKEGIYRYGGDGGRYDISHVELNGKSTRVKKRHPLPESAEQCAARHGFGANKKYSVILRLQRYGVTKNNDGIQEEERAGILEWPDFGAGVVVSCTMHADGAITVTEKQLVFGSKDAGWEARFGQPSFVSGTVLVLSPTEASVKESAAELSSKSPYVSFYEELLGSTSFRVTALRNRANGEKLRVISEMRLFRGRKKEQTTSISNVAPIEAPIPPPIHFDREYHASSMSLSRDGRTVSCVASDGRGAAFASVGFSKGVHYWEVKLEQADIGSVFIGVAEKPNSSGSGGSFDAPPRLNRWPGWGFVNFRATYSSGAERVYGSHCHAGDTVGVLLDCDAGRVSFFFDGLKYGEHILNDLGCAFENLSPFGFNVDGCGSGGAGQGAPSGIEGGRGGRYPAQGSVRPRALWPVIGLRNQGDRVTLSPKWSTSYGVDGVTSVGNVLAVDELLYNYSENAFSPRDKHSEQSLPEWFVREAFTEYRRWHSDKWRRAVTRGSGPYRQASFGLDIDVDTSPLACAAASAALGMKHALLAGDRVRLLRSAGRILELAEEAIVLGAFQGRLYYQIVSQKSEGGSLTEGGGRAWCWDESEVVDGLPYVGKGQAEDIELPIMDRFKCKSLGGLKISYDGGAVVRSDLEIIDGSVNLGVIPVDTIIPQNDVLERRVNSCGVTRYRVRAKLGDDLSEGWISARIRGGKEESIVEPIEAKKTEAEDDSENVVVSKETKSFASALECALAWKEEYDKLKSAKAPDEGQLAIQSFDDFKKHVDKGIFGGLSAVESDSLLAAAISAISNFSDCGDAVDCSFKEIRSAMEFSLGVNTGSSDEDPTANPAANQAAAATLSIIEPCDIPSIEALMARSALVRAFNRRARLALPWISVRPCQEGSAIFGGLCGHGASTERSGRNRLVQSQELWVQIPSLASRVRSLRNLFFSSVKKRLLQSITEATATPTPLSHDEYELPREIRTVRLNRLRSRIAMNGHDNGAKRKYSVFAQLHNETKGWGGAALRRGYVAKGHGGQRRAFKVKLIGEGVNDYSGPYREAFTDAMMEVLDVDPAVGGGSLGVLDPTPNNGSDIGDHRELFMFSLNGRKVSDVKTRPNRAVSEEEYRIRQSFSSLTAPRDEASREVEEALVFLGRITGTAYRHSIPVDLPLPLHSVWKAIAEEESKEEDRLRELDELAYRQKSSDESSHPLLWWQQRMLNSFVEGLSNVLPVEVLTLLDGRELRDVVCGNAEVDVDLLRSVVEYEGYGETDEVIKYFWETLREFTNAERKLFLQFTAARNRLPNQKSDFETPFKIQRDSANDQALPTASTCFFSLALPEYSSQKQLKEKLLFAINNVTTMETDFQTNSAEIAEGYRAFSS